MAPDNASPTASRQRQQRQDGLPVPRRYWSAAAIWLTISMAVLDGTIANVALPTIAREIGASPASSVWVINAYQLTITVFLLPLAALGDLLGYRRIYLPGVLLFVLGSAACALGHSLVWLIVARMVQGIGAAAIMSMNAALVRATYPSDQLGRGIGYNALVLSISAAAGPTIAALVLELGRWPWLFLINIPIGLAAFLIGMRSLPDGDSHGNPFDWIAGLLSALTLGLIVFGAETTARTGSLGGIVAVVAGILAGVFLVRREWSDPKPLLPLDLLRIPIFALSICTSIVSFAAQMLAYVSLPFLFQTTLHRSVLETGLLMTPWPIAVGITAPIAGRLADRMHSGLLGAIGLAVFATGLFLLSRMGSHPATIDVAWRMAVCGIGFGLFQSPNNRTIVSSAPHERSGAAGGMLATARLLGQTGGAVSVAAAFHLAGLGAGPHLLLAASIIAALAAAVSLTRLAATHPDQPRPGQPRTE
ncbi:MFS transporter [Sphingomonas ginkgonis]|uniref:MFS transporter n=1 Tax=Sphingomonas ginkgonis TaxID=2315330 RepID=A0A429VBT3_9SPHN|nr:MFS transporter [Sphingomonas ginkgonis]RST31463.1 MFS transporter [Sphingomonas ginkgonis]